VSAEALPTSDPQVQDVELPAGRLAFVDEGPKEAQALLAIHGIPGSVRDFRYLAPQLAGALRVVRVDLPGFGGSAAVNEAIDDLSVRAEMLVALADRLGLRRFAVAGHSMGGATAMVLAADHPERVTHLVLIASVALSLHRGLGMTPRAFGLLARGVTTPVVGPWLQRSVRAAYRRRRFPGVDEMDAAALQVQLRSAAAIDFARIRRIVAGPLPPTLLAYARDDQMVETWIAEELSRALPRARAVFFDDGGHNIQKTRAVELAREIRALMGVSPQPPDISAKPISL
jgi:pimeloyl-ACP methyl ester carboxylesterase